MENIRHSDCFASFGPSPLRTVPSPASHSTFSSLPVPWPSSHPASKSSKATSITTSPSETVPQAFGDKSDPDRQTAKTIDARPITLENHCVGLNATTPSNGHQQIPGMTYRARHVRLLPASTSYPPLNVDCEPDLDLESPRLRGLRAFMGQTKYLLSSCCLLDCRMPQYPVLATTDDRISRHMDMSVLHPKAGENPKAYLLQTMQYSQSTRLFLIVKRPVTSCSNGKLVLTMAARVDITGLLGPSGFAEHVDDIWLNVAADEMEGALHERPHLLNHIPETNFLFTSSGLIPLVEQVNALYDSFFVIEPSAQPGGYEVTYVSSINCSARDMQLTRITSGINSGLYKLACLLAQRYKFIFDARAEAEGPHEIVWCLPLAGVGLKCWICFLLDSVA